MSIKLRMVLCIIALSILGAIFIVADSADEMRHKPEYTADSSAIDTESGVFFMENWNHKGWLYRIDPSGKVLAMTGAGTAGMERSDELTVYNGRLYALYSSNETDKDGSFRVYRIIVYDSELEMVSVSDHFTLADTGRVSSITVDDVFMYLSIIAEDGKSVSVCQLRVSDLKGSDLLEDDTSEPDKNGADTPVTRDDFRKPEYIIHQDRSAERFFVEACYRNAQLYVLMDSDTPTGYFAPSPDVKNAVDNISFSFGQNIRLRSSWLIRILGILAIWIILVILTLKLTKERDRIVYLYLGSEVVFFLILFVAFLFIRQQFQRNETKNYMAQVRMVMRENLEDLSGVDYDSKTFFESKKYYEILDELSNIVKYSDQQDVFHDAFIMRKSTGLVLADCSGNNRMPVSYLYGGEMTALVDQMKKDPDSASVTFLLEGEEMIAVAYQGENPKDDVAAVAVYRSQKGLDRSWASVRDIGVIFIVIYLVGSVLLFFVLYMQHVDLKRFSRALKGLALEKEEREESPKKISRDMRELWQCYGELAKRYDQINYDKYMIYEAYYRFAPRGIEDIMGKESILDVRNGDVVKVAGIVILLSVNKEEDFQHRVQNISRIFSSMEVYARQNEGVLISREPSFANMRFLLLKDEKTTVPQILQVSQNSAAAGILDSSILLYRDQLIYGVAGSDSQSLTYIDSEYSRELDSYAEWFRRLGIPMVATENIIKAHDVGEKRYIGKAYFEESGREVRFYEMLDAYPAKTRQLMLINREKFEATLELYGSRDYYLARNQFMEILKECPEDGMTKWYIFECEKYMSEDEAASQSGYIRVDQ